MSSDDPRYPVGKFETRSNLTPDDRRALIGIIAEAPQHMRDAVSGLNDHQLDTPYRDGGWTVRQVVHHVPDSHMNAFIRLKFALTENEPTIKPYDEAEWAKLADVRDTPIEVSLTLLESLHARWVMLWRSMSDADFARTLIHPDHGVRNIDWLLQMYAWHSRHHVAHITSTRVRNSW
jgi:hypothetical protein